ncbi:MAG: Thivi_2564 family membrane protein [Terrimicrobiaceae bacterium]
MSLINVLIALIVVGVLLWLVNNFIPMDRKIKSILNAIVVICVVLWLLSAFGILQKFSGIQLPQF